MKKIGDYSLPRDGYRTFRSLDGLRGIAALLVAFYHWNVFHWMFSFYGYMAVDLFFVLSGFILAHRYLYACSIAKESDFLVARFARLYPMHLFALFFFIAVYVYVNGEMPAYADGTLLTFVQQLTLTHNVGLNSEGLTWNMPSWSISTEFWVSVAFIAFVARGTKTATLILVSAFILVGILGLSGSLDQTLKNYYQVFNAGLLRCWASFSLGIVSYRIWLYFNSGAIPTNLIAAVESIAMFFVLVAVFYLTGFEWQRLHFYMPFLFGIFIACIALERTSVSRFLGRFEFLGRISYSVYLNHFPVLILVGHIVPVSLSNSVGIISYFSIVIVVSVLTYNFIEVPGKRRIIKLYKSFFAQDSDFRVSNK